jgi:acyl transferase domain-containing protein
VSSFLGPSYTQASTGKTLCTPRLLPLSANTSESLRRRATGIEAYIDSNSEAVGDVAHTLALRREHLSHRAFGICSPTNSLKISNFAKTARKVPAVNYVFTGQGAQWATMGIELINSFPQFRNDILHLDKVLHGLPDAPEWSIQGTH